MPNHSDKPSFPPEHSSLAEQATLTEQSSLTEHSSFTEQSSFTKQIEEILEPVMSPVEGGYVRILTQLRRWGWLFNPITVYIYFDNSDTPIAAVAEVTNTPWKERQHYAFRLQPENPDKEAVAPENTADKAVADKAASNGSPATSRKLVYRAEFKKSLHVSPFLDQNFVYKFSFKQTENPQQPNSTRIEIVIDVQRPDGSVVLETALKTSLVPANKRTLQAETRKAPLSTLKTSAAIHVQALKLWRKKVPFVKHPKKLQTAESEINKTGEY